MLLASNNIPGMEGGGSLRPRLIKHVCIASGQSPFLTMVWVQFQGNACVVCVTLQYHSTNVAFSCVSGPI
jgi:hypothetical protein